MRNDIKLIIIPDIHGRNFWKDAIGDSKDATIVFLGDYLDPYGFEGITNTEAWNNFMEIVDFKRANPERVHLLLGNHDCGYLDRRINECRRDWSNAGRIRRFLLEELNLFDLAYETTVSGKRYLFSHAGVTRAWHENHFGAFDTIGAELYNSMLHGCGHNRLMEALADISSWRGGDCSFGSMVWADIHEHGEEGAETPGIIQIVGHTMLNEGPVMVGNGDVFSLDCRRTFALTCEGDIVEASERLT